MLLPEFGGRILSIIYKPTGHEQLYRTEVGVPYGMGGGNFYYDWLMVYGGIFPDLAGCRARQDVAEAVGFQGCERERRRSDGVDVADGQFRIFGGAGQVQEGIDAASKRLTM